MTNFTYKFWEPNQGLEEQQAEIYNEANPAKFQPATAEQIKQQYKKDKPNSEHIRYAFLEEKMVGYIQAKIKSEVKVIILSYPWTLKDTPTEVRDNLFDEMIESFRSKTEYSEYSFQVNPFPVPEENVEFLKSRSFIEKNIWKILLLPIKEVAATKYGPEFTSRIGTKEDIDAVISLMKEDGTYSSQFDSDEKIRKYLEEKVFSVGHLVLVYEEGVLKAAAAPLVVKPSEEEEERIILRFAAFKKVKDQRPFIPLFIEIAKECINSGYGDNLPILVYTDNMDTPKEEQEFLQSFTPVKSTILMYYYYLKV
ncbi:MAG: hypothetical protein ACXACP_02120 [Candidatus Hodarchaeales archaeon]|jgi:hypothetical protein